MTFGDRDPSNRASNRRNRQATTASEELAGRPLAAPRPDQASSRPDDPTVHRAVILAAGKRSRLQSLTNELPKCLLPVAGIPLLERAINVLAAPGVEQAVVVAGYRAPDIRERFGTSYDGVTMTYVNTPDFETTNNVKVDLR